MKTEMGLTKKSFFSKIFKNNILKFKKIIFLVIAKNDLLPPFFLQRVNSKMLYLFKFPVNEVFKVFLKILCVSKS